MIDPDSILQVQENKLTKLNFTEVPEFDYLIWDLEDQKELNKYFKTIEREVRGSFEYRKLIRFLKENMNMDQCAFIKTSNNDKYDIKIEIHHYPFTLYDIVELVYHKRVSLNESIDVQLVAKEVTMLHYKLLVGLIPLSTTVHQLVHSSKLFIPVQNVLGRYREFIDYYKQYSDCSETLEILNRIEQYSLEQQSSLHNTVNILNNNNIRINNINNDYSLPDFNTIQDSMNNRITTIKSNNYILPSISDTKSNNIDNTVIHRTIKCPVYFSKKE